MRWIVAAVLLLVVSDVQAQGRRWRRQQWQPVQTVMQPIFVSKTVENEPKASSERVVKPTECYDALAEVNAARASRGLPPYQKDPLLCQAAFACAKARAASLNDGHTSNDFAYLPSGASATSAGCAAWEPSFGWGSCCTYDGYTFAGAAFVVGSDGRRYMHLFVR